MFGINYKINIKLDKLVLVQRDHQIWVRRFYSHYWKQEPWNMSILNGATGPQSFASSSVTMITKCVYTVWECSRDLTLAIAWLLSIHKRVYSTVFFVWQEMTHGDVKVHTLHHLKLNVDKSYNGGTNCAFRYWFNLYYKQSHVYQNKLLGNLYLIRIKWKITFCVHVFVHCVVQQVLHMYNV